MAEVRFRDYSIFITEYGIFAVGNITEERLMELKSKWTKEDRDE